MKELSACCVAKPKIKRGYVIMTFALKFYLGAILGLLK
jgi:hypothetical protein